MIDLCNYLDFIPKAIILCKDTQYMLLATDVCIDLEEIAGIWETYNCFLASQMLKTIN
jgi:hypothetical protein